MYYMKLKTNKQTEIRVVCRNNAFLLWLIQKALSEHSQNQHL